MGNVYSALKFRKYILVAHSGSFGKKYDQYHLTIYKERLSGLNHKLRFSTKKDLTHFYNLLVNNMQNVPKEKTLFDILIATTHEWGGDKKLKTKRLLSQICEGL